MEHTSTHVSPSFDNDLYVAYSRKDQDHVEALEVLFRAIQVKIWRDVHELINQNLCATFTTGIRSSKFFCCVLSEHTNSAWIEYEVSTFFNSGRLPSSLILLSLTDTPQMPPTLRERDGASYRLIDLKQSLIDGFCEVARLFAQSEVGLLRLCRHRDEVLPDVWDTLYRYANRRIDLMGHSMAPAFRDQRDKTLVLPALRDRRVKMRVILLDPSKPELQQPKEVQGSMLGGAVITAKIRETIGYMETLRQLGLKAADGSEGLEYTVTTRIMYSTVSFFDNLAIATPYTNQNESGDRSPTMVLASIGDKTRELLDFYEEEFNRYWDSAKPADSIRKELSRVYDYAATFLEAHKHKLHEAWRGECLPEQVEIHPPPPDREACWLRCPHCYGHGETIPESHEKLEIATALKVIKDLKDPLVSRIVISGTYSDPLHSGMVPQLLRAARDSPRQQIGLHTKLVNLKPEVESAILDNCQDGDYIAISLDAGTAATYDLVHGISSGRRVKRTYDNVRRNVLQLSRQVREKRVPLRINLTYLLTNESTESRDIQQAVELAVEAGVDVIRFSVPQPRTLASTDAMMVFPGALERARTVINELKIVHHGRRPLILLAEFSKWDISKFERCFSQLFYPAVGGDGFLYPCCQVASKDFARLRIGDLRHEGFWALWKGERRQQLIRMDPGDRGCSTAGKMNCRVCNRKDGAINAMLNEREWDAFAG